MKSTKCPQCGLVYWSTAPNCKRCGLPTADFEGERPAPETHEGLSGAPPQNNYYAPPQPVRTIGDDARDNKLMKHLKGDTRLFYFIGAVQALAWFVVGNLLIVDAVLNIGLAFIAYKFRSRVASIFLLLLTILSVLVALSMFAGDGVKIGPLAPVFLILRLYASGRIVYATFTLKKYAVETFVLPPPPPRFHPDGAPQWGTPAPSTQWQ